MNRMKQLINAWEAASNAEVPVHEYGLLLTTRDFARIRALAEIFPARSETELVSELLTSALDEIEEALPYVPGKKVVAEDEFGDPLYEDVGPTPRFEALTHEYADRLRREKT